MSIPWASTACSCATQYASEYFDATIYRDGSKYTLHFEKGENIGGLHKEPTDRGRKTGSTFRWKPDLESLPYIDIPVEYYLDVMKRQAVVNSGVTFRFRNQTGGSSRPPTSAMTTASWTYVTELAGGKSPDPACVLADRAEGPGPGGQAEYKVKLSVSFCFSNRVSIVEHYHNSSWLEHGGSPEKAMKSAFVSAIDARLKQLGKYQKSEGKISFNDIQDCLVLVSNNFSTQTSYENQTKEAINNKFVQEAMTDFLRAQLEVYFIENPFDADKICEQVLINKRSRETAEKTRLNIKRSCPAPWTSPTGYRSSWTAAPKDVSRREPLRSVEGRLVPWGR